MAGRPRSIPDDKIFDVSKPGRSKPMGTSRPVIVNNRTLVRDQTVTEKPGEKAQPLSAPSITRKKITPITDADAPTETPKTEEAVADGVDKPEESDEAAVEAETETAPEEETEEVKAEAEQPAEASAEEEPTEEAEVSEPAAESTEPDEEKTEEDSKTEDIEPPAGSDSASVDALAEASEKKKLSAKEEEEQAKRDATLQGLIDSKQYVVPIAHDSGKGGHKGIWVLFVIILLAVGAYAAIDSGALDVNVELPYHFFKQ